LLQKNVSDVFYLVANNDSKQLKSYIECISKACKFKGKCLYSPEENFEKVGLDVDATQNFKAINYYPEVSFMDGLKMIIDKKSI